MGKFLLIIQILIVGDRIGNLTIVMKNPSKMEAIKSQMMVLVTLLYLTPPAHGCRIVDKILNDEHLKQEWLKDLKSMSSRISKMRQMLHDNLIALKTPGNWNHIVDQIGMFSYTGIKGSLSFIFTLCSAVFIPFLISENHCRILTDKFSIYMPPTGRICIAGLNEKNVHYVAQAIHKVVTESTVDMNDNYKETESIGLLKNLGLIKKEKFIKTGVA